MMTHTIPEMLQTKNPPRRSIVGPKMTSQNCVRVYRASTEDVSLQLRRSRDIVVVSLSFDECRVIAAMLIAAAEGR